MQIFKQLYYPIDNLLFLVAQKYNGQYFEDEELLIECKNKTTSNSKTKKAVFTYQGRQITIVSPIADGPIRILVHSKSNYKETFSLLPKSTLSLFDLLGVKIFKTWVQKIISNSFVYKGDKTLGQEFKESNELNQLLKNQEYAIHFKNKKRPTIFLRPFHGLYTMSDLVNCLEILILIDKSIVNR